MAFQTIIYYFGYCAALYLFKDMGRVFFVPMLLNMWFNLFITFEIYRQVDFRWFIALQGILWFIWVIVLANYLRRKLEITLVSFLLLIAFFFGTLPQLLTEFKAFGDMVELGTRIWTAWHFTSLILILVVVIRSTIIARIKGEFIDLITNPRKRFLIPLGLCSATIAVLPLLSGAVPEDIVIQRFNIASHVLVWTWVAFELPFYIMYERLKRHHP
jgi:hypothetical protein